MGRGSKANHLSYLGDAIIGEGVNVGAGAITCNYDGVDKHRTIIEDGAFVGSDSTLVAPVTIGAGAYVAAGVMHYRRRAGGFAGARKKPADKQGRLGFGEEGEQRQGVNPVRASNGQGE